MTIKLSYPKKSVVYTLKKLWKKCFEGSDAYIDLFFENAFSEENCIVAFYYTKPIGMIFLLPVTMTFGDSVYNGCYLYAIATDPEYRNRGVMKSLEKAAVQHGQLNDYDFLCLVPETESLFSMYQKLGYKTTFYINNRNVLAFTNGSKKDIEITPADKYEFLRMREEYLKSIYNYMEFSQPHLQEYRYEELKVLGCNIDIIKLHNESYYVISYMQKNTLVIREASMEQSVLSEALPTLCAIYDCAFVKLLGKNGPRDSVIGYGMFKWIDPLKCSPAEMQKVKEQHIYMNLMFD